MKLLLGLIVCGLIAWLLVYAFTALFSSSARAARAEKKNTAQALTVTRKREKIATQALRKIANGAGRPDLEAQIALDEIENTYEKENL